MVTCIWRENQLCSALECSSMSGFDEPGVFYSEAFFSDDRSEDGDISRVAAQRRFKEFIKTFLDHDNVYCYRSASSHT